MRQRQLTTKHITDTNPGSERDMFHTKTNLGSQHVSTIGQQQQAWLKFTQINMKDIHVRYVR